MKFFIAATAFLGLAAATPTVEPLSLESRADGPAFVRVKTVKANGSGCPTGSAEITLDEATNSFTVSYSDFYTETPGRPKDRRKNCKIDINMEFEEGWQFSVLDTSTRGFAEIPRGVTGTCQNDFSFSQNPGKVVSARKALRGKWDGPFNLDAPVNIISWSRCGDHTGILELNSQCWLPRTQKEASIVVDSVSGSLDVIVAYQFRRCRH
jgi:hypothetical protein